jgi:hypothetical protein
MNDDNGTPASLASDFRGISLPEVGDVRIVNFGLYLVGDQAIPAPGMRTEVRADMWHHWLNIARTGAAAASLARAANPGLDDPDGFGPAVIAEMQPALMAVTAGAFALEAFHASVRHHLPGVHIHAKSADGRVHQALVRAFVMSNTRSRAIRGDLQKIFRLRDRGVHPPSTWAEPSLHPIFQNAMNPQYVAYRAENAESVLVFTYGVIRYCLEHPRRTHPNLIAWCDAVKPNLGDQPPTWDALVGQENDLGGSD